MILLSLIMWRSNPILPHPKDGRVGVWDVERPNLHGEIATKCNVIPGKKKIKRRGI